jgi:hypothetical protein
MPCILAGRTAIRVALAAALLAASAACSPSGADKAGPTATVRTEPERTTTTNPYAVPAVIDAAYVNRVLAGLDAAIGDVTRLVLRTRTIPPEAYDRLKALYADPVDLQVSIDGFQKDIRENFGFYRTDPGNEVTLVSELITAHPDCIFTRVRRDYTPVGVSPSASLEVQWVGLKPLDRSRDPNGFNPTPWEFVYDGFPPNHAEPKNPCAN